VSDVLIVGGGVIGCSVAYELASRHRAKVTVLERAVPGAEASSAAAGILGAQIESHGVPADRSLFELMLASRERHRVLDEQLRDAVGFGTGFRRCGVLRLNGNHDDYAWQAAPVHALSREDALKLEPALNPSLTGALHLPDEAQCDPPQLLRALQQACASLGVTFKSGTIVRGVSSEGVHTEDGVARGDAIVVAAGSWSSQIAGLPERLRRVRPVRGQIVQVDTRPPIVRNIVFGDRGYVVARPDGRTLLGSTMEEVGHVKEVTAGGVHTVLMNTLALIPGLADAPITGTWCGFRPATTEDRPMIGRVSGNLFVATGHHRNGVLLAPETARLVADLVATGTCDRDLAPFSPEAFEDRRDVRW
jgi:glycine oxidase